MKKKFIASIIAILYTICTRSYSAEENQFNFGSTIISTNASVMVPVKDSHKKGIHMSNFSAKAPSCFPCHKLFSKNDLQYSRMYDGSCLDDSSLDTQKNECSVNPDLSDSETCGNDSSLLGSMVFNNIDLPYSNKNDNSHLYESTIFSRIDLDHSSLDAQNSDYPMFSGTTSSNRYFSDSDRLNSTFFSNIDLDYSTMYNNDHLKQARIISTSNDDTTFSEEISSYRSMAINLPEAPKSEAPKIEFTPDDKPNIWRLTSFIVDTFFLDDIHEVSISNSELKQLKDSDIESIKGFPHKHNHLLYALLFFDINEPVTLTHGISSITLLPKPANKGVKGERLSFKNFKDVDYTERYDNCVNERLYSIPRMRLVNKQAYISDNRKTLYMFMEIYKFGKASYEIPIELYPFSQKDGSSFNLEKKWKSASLYIRINKF